jgi:two-component system chemotaxis sensor kinase CheA
VDELLEQFLIEGRELVQQASDDLLALDRAPDDAGLIDSAFRAVHTLKGSVGLFDFRPMGDALHAAEDLLTAMRERRFLPDSASLDVLLECVGQSERWLDAIASNFALPSDAGEKSRRLATSLRARLEEPPGVPQHGTNDARWVDALLDQRPDAESRDSAAPLLAVRYTPHPECFFSGDDPVSFVRAIPGLIALRIGQREPWPPPESSTSSAAIS